MRLLKLLVFFPSITFNLLSAEIFPWSFFYATVKSVRYVSLSTLVKKIKDDAILPFFLLLFISTLFAYLYASSYRIEKDCLRSLFAYLNPLCIYLFLLKSPIGETTSFHKLIGYILLFYIILGFLQFFELIGFLQPLFGFLMRRGNTELLGEFGGRGVCLLTNEPSYAAMDTMFVYLAWRYLHTYSGMKKCILDTMIFLFLALIIRSSTGVVMFAVYLLFEYKLKIVVLTLIAVPLLIPFISMAEERALQFLYTISTLNSINDVYPMVLNLSGDRMGSVIAAYNYLFTHPWGTGIGLWESISVKILENPGFDLSLATHLSTKGYFRPTSYMASVAMEMGILGVILLLNLLKPLFPLLKDYKSIVFSTIGTCLFSILFYGTIGNPMVWLCMAVCFRNYKVAQNK